MQSNTNYYTGIASEYLVLSMLYRMEINACMCIGNTKSVDILIRKQDNTAITLDVKAVRGYSSLIVNNVRAEEHHYVCFVTYNSKFSDVNELPEFFIVPCKEVLKIQKNFNGQKRVFKKDLLIYKDKWNYIS